MNNTKPLGYKNYGSIPHLSNSKINQQADKKVDMGMETILTKKTRDYHDLIIIQEKLDGGNVGVAKKDGVIIPIGRSGYEANTSPYKQYHIFHKWVIAHYDRFDKILEEGERICGEWLYQVCTLKYHLPHEPFVAFDLFLDKETRMTYIDFIKRVSKSDIVTPYLVHIGQPISTDKAMKLLGQGNHGCLDIPEGVVYRVERGGKVDFLAKFVRAGKEDGLYMSSSRAIAFVGIADDIEKAEVIAENAVKAVKGPVFHREDIGTKELINKKLEHIKKLRE